MCLFIVQNQEEKKSKIDMKSEKEKKRKIISVQSVL